MFSTIFSIVLAVGSICVGNAIYGKGESIAEDQPGYKAVAKCYETGWKAIASDLRAKGGHVEGAEKTGELCIFFRVRVINRLTSKLQGSISFWRE